jgi:endonuclease YncB( thermonuclease family)
MQKFYRFWKKDILNKVIVVVLLLIAVVVAVNIFLFMTHRISGRALLADFFPTPTIGVEVIMTGNAETAVYRSFAATASVPPTITTMPITPRPKVTALAAAGATSTVIAVTATPTATVAMAAGLECIPTASVQTGKVVSIVDGYTIKVLIDGLVYTVRYAGIELPADPAYADQAAVENGKLVYGKEISLVADQADKDQLGRLLRYITLNDTLVNLELVQQGLAVAQNTDPLLSCADVFQNAEQSARDAKKGYWKTAPAP